MKTKKKYLFALDLDGTLLRDNKTISFITRKYLKKLENDGHYIVLCSGRAPRTMLTYYHQMKLNSPYISYNGALISLPKESNLNSTKYYIDQNFIKKLYDKTIGKEVTSAFAENKDTIYYDNDDDFLFAFFNKGNLKIVKGNLDNILDKDAFVYVMKIKDESEETKESLRKIVEEMSDDYEIRFWWDCPYAEIHVKGVSKAHSLSLLADELKFSKDNILVFGDADNDIEMLSNFKHSFLMKNGNPKIRKYAKYVTSYTNNQNGVIKEIKKFIKNDK